MRNKKRCVLCGVEAININRHLRSVHLLRSPAEFKKIKTKISRNSILAEEGKGTRRQCLYCKNYFSRLDRHYIRRHGHVASDKKHLNYLRNSHRLRKSIAKTSEPAAVADPSDKIISETRDCGELGSRSPNPRISAHRDDRVEER